MTLSSISLVRITQCPPSTPFLTPLPDTPPIEISTQKFQGTFIRVKNILQNIRSDPVIHVSGKVSSTFSKYPPSWPSHPDTLPFEISSHNFQGMFLRVKEHHSWSQEWPCHPCLWSGALNFLQLTPFLIPPAWHTSNLDIKWSFGQTPKGLAKGPANLPPQELEWGARSTPIFYF